MLVGPNIEQLIAEQIKVVHPAFDLIEMEGMAENVAESSTKSVNYDFLYINA